MRSDEAVVAVIEALDALSVPYTLVGSFASNAYGIPRSTGDADFVIVPGAATIRDVADRLGPSFRLDPQISFETATGTIWFQVQVVGTPFEIEFFLLREDPHERERFQRRRPVSLGGRQALVLSPEDVIISKLRWIRAAARAKDEEDVRNVLAVQRDNLDWGYIHRWCDAHVTREILDRVKESVPSV